MPSSPSTWRVPGVVAPTSRPSVASSGSRSTTEWTSVVAPPTSTTTTSRASVRASPSPPGSTKSGVGPRTIAAKSARELRCLPPITWARNISRIAARAGPGESTPILGTTLSASTYGVADPARSPATSSRASTLPATTTGVAQRAPASIRAPASSASVLPPSVPPTSSTTSDLLASSPGNGPGSAARATTCTTLPPLDSATRRPASAVTSSSCPTIAPRSPPPADEHASTFAPSTSGWSARSAPRHASYPSRMSVSIVVRWEGVPTRVPDATSTRAALVNVDPKSTHSTSSPTEGGLQVRDQVVGGLDADAQPDQVGRHLELGACDRGVRHPARVLDQRLDAAERLPEREHLGPVAHRQRLLLAA